jgi:hypothetical protein
VCNQNPGTVIEAASAIATKREQLMTEGTYKTCFQCFCVRLAVQTDNRTSIKGCVGGHRTDRIGHAGRKVFPICTPGHEPLLWWGQRGEGDESGVVGATNALWARQRADDPIWNL